MASFENAYQAACDARKLPGVILMAADKTGAFSYNKAMGFRSSAPESSRKPLQHDTVLCMASCTKLLTAIAVLQCVEKGLFTLDEDVSRILPELENVKIITGFDDDNGKAILQDKKSPITMRLLLSHSSGLCYDLISPLLLKWRTSLGEVPWTAPTIETRCNSPLLFEPGSSWMYSVGAEWAGKMVERATGETLETYMGKNIWDHLGLKDITFWPAKRDDMKDRIAEMSTWDADGKTIPLADFDLIGGSTDCLGGGGVFATASDYMTILKAVMVGNEKLLKADSYEQLFQSQLSEASKKGLQDLLEANEVLFSELGGNLPLTGQKSWGLCGLVSLDEYPGWHGKNTLLWQGMPHLRWFIDRENGLCGFVAAQLVALDAPEIKALSKMFQEEIYTLYRDSKVGT